MIDVALKRMSISCQQREWHRQGRLNLVSVRLPGDELAAVEQAARAVDMLLSTFIRQTAFRAASPLDVRAASARAEAIEVIAYKFSALLRAKSPESGSLTGP